MEVSRKTFEQSNNSTQNLLLFDSIMAVSKKIDARDLDCDNKHVVLDKKIVRSGHINKGISSGSGLLGGFAAVIMARIFGVGL